MYVLICATGDQDIRTHTQFPFEITHDALWVHRIGNYFCLCVCVRARERAGELSGIKQCLLEAIWPIRRAEFAAEKEA